MSVFNKVLEQMKNESLNGHAVRNIKNIKSLAKAKEEIERMFITDNLQEMSKMNDINSKFNKLLNIS
ncbi:MAG: hypothetical protein WC667_12435 [Sulfurimonas sp.]|jgi:hypothetical protein